MALIGRLVRRTGTSVAKVARGKVGRKILGKVARGLPILGTAYAAYDIAKDITGLAGPGTFGQAYGKALAKKQSLPTIPGLPAIAPGRTGGLIPQGPGGRLQLPWSDPSTPQALKAFALDDSYLKQQVRAPKGYVVVRDASGRPYPLMRSIAVRFRLWKPSKKPPISVGEYQALKKADRTIRRMRKIYAQIAYVDKGQRGGKVKVKKRKQLAAVC